MIGWEHRQRLLSIGSCEKEKHFCSWWLFPPPPSYRPKIVPQVDWVTVG